MSGGIIVTDDEWCAFLFRQLSAKHTNLIYTAVKDGVRVAEGGE